ncbi:MAG: hypothetical protein OJF50_003175 [Nitrospira sp.]|nr:hypothetical protein [Nitrospira sp.]
MTEKRNPIAFRLLLSAGQDEAECGCGGINRPIQRGLPQYGVVIASRCFSCQMSEQSNGRYR